jgi:hypothetical protein
MDWPIAFSMEGRFFDLVLQDPLFVQICIYAPLTWAISLKPFSLDDRLVFD